MRLNELKNFLSSFLSGDLRAETENMLKSLGFIPMNQAGQAGQAEVSGSEDREKDRLMRPGENNNSAAVDRACEVIGMCEMAELPASKMVELIKSNMTMKDIKKAIVDARAAASARQQIISTVSATGLGERNPVTEDARKRAEASKRRQEA